MDVRITMRQAGTKKRQSVHTASKWTGTGPANAADLFIIIVVVIPLAHKHAGFKTRPRVLRDETGFLFCARIPRLKSRYCAMKNSSAEKTKGANTCSIKQENGMNGSGCSENKVNIPRKRSPDS